jgi:hypothetical protein
VCLHEKDEVDRVLCGKVEHFDPLISSEAINVKE